MRRHTDPEPREAEAAALTRAGEGSSPFGSTTHAQLVGTHVRRGVRIASWSNGSRRSALTRQILVRPQGWQLTPSAAPRSLTWTSPRGSLTTRVMSRARRASKCRTSRGSAARMRGNRCGRTPSRPRRVPRSLRDSSVAERPAVNRRPRGFDPHSRSSRLQRLSRLLCPSRLSVQTAGLRTRNAWFNSTDGRSLAAVQRGVTSLQPKPHLARPFSATLHGGLQWHGSE